MAHGAGGHQNHPHLLALSHLLTSLDEYVARVVRFDFPYRLRGSKLPDPMPVLIEAYREVAEQSRATARMSKRRMGQAQKQIAAESPRLILAGHSLGGRVATMLAAEGFPCDGLILFSYPLHPPGKPEQLRAAHLGKIKVPVLALSGTRDAFCEPDRMKTVLKKLPTTWTQHWLEGADHGWDTLKRGGKATGALKPQAPRTREDVLAEAKRACLEWFAGLKS